MSFSRELRDELGAIGVSPRLIAESPEQWRLGSMVLSIDRAGDRAMLKYARQPVARNLRCDAASVVAGYRRARDRLVANSLAPDAMFGALVRAYGSALSDRGAAPGARIALVDLLGEVAAAAGRGYTRAQFAYDLCRLRREGELGRDGLRLELGVATGSETSRKSRVVWLEDSAGSGQYFATLRVLPARDSPSKEPT